ncbi:MAG TPA: hypothetical protein VH643_08175 [Gemmataceae bacterium]|jgi:hypothetical protein
MDALLARWKTMMKDVPKSEWYTPENNAKWLKMYEEMRGSLANKKRTPEFERLDKDLQKYVDTGTSKRGSPDVPHGYVWLFRRK